MLARSTRTAARAVSRSCRGSSSTHLPCITSSTRYAAPPSPSQPHSRPKSTQRHSSASAWAAATESAHSVLEPPPAHEPAHDPLSAIHAEISTLKDSLFRLLGSSHPTLDTIAKYYFHTEGKHLRPLLVLLMSQATNGLGGEWARVQQEARYSVDDSLTAEGGVLNDWNPEMSGREGATTFATPFRIPNLAPPPPMLAEPLAPLSTSGNTAADADGNDISILPTQRRLASITEMIHVASLLHDDVIDASPLRRGQPSAASAFGNKLSILSGDFLLGRASVALARLGDREVVELLATVIANLVEGEVMQLRATSEPERTPTPKGFEDYMRKTYLKTASLMAKSARAAVILGGCGRGEGEWVKEVAYGYGRNLGIAFQLVDDALDFLPAPDLGKPGAGADLKLGLATAPALFAWEEAPQLGPLILRKFSEPGDVETAKEIVQASKGLERTIELARHFADEARALIRKLPESPARGALEELTVKVVDRLK